MSKMIVLSFARVGFVQEQQALRGWPKGLGHGTSLKTEHKIFLMSSLDVVILQLLI